MADFGPLEPLLADPSVTEIMVNGPHQIFVERHGRLEEVTEVFDSEAHLMRIITDTLAAPLGRTINESFPIVDLRLADGSRVHIVIPPIAQRGASIVIRRFPARMLAVDDLLGFGTFSAPMVDFLRAAVQGRTNIVMSGGTGSGKTTILNVLCGMIAPEERIIIIENTSEMRVQQPHLVVLETRPPNIEGRGEITARQLMASAMKMRPERIVLSEALGGEVLEMLNAFNTGHDGSLMSIHATSPRDALNRMEVMVTMGMAQMPLLSIRQQIASAIHLVLHQDRMSDGTRRMTRISEVTGLEGGMVTLEDVFVFVQTGFAHGRVLGEFRATGYVPRVVERIRGAGIPLADAVFEG